MPKAFPQIIAGQKVDINWRKEDYLIACCDCLLTHRFRFVVSGNKLRIRAWRENHKTGALRRHRDSLLKQERERADRLEAMVDRMAETLVDKDAIIYELRKKQQEATC